MRVTMEFRSNKSEMVLPIHYTEWLQAAIYGSMGNPLARVVHDEGFPVDKRRFRLFTFSRLIGKYHIQRETITLFFPVSLVIASPLPTMIQEFVNSIVSRSEFRLGPETLLLSKVSLDNGQPSLKTHLRVRTLSPITVHSTLTKGDGSRYTVYYHPREPDFSRQITQNLLHKYQAIHGQPWVPSAPAEVRVQPRNEPKMNIVYYKDTMIKGYSGTFELSGPVPLLQVGWDAGYGDRGSQGFGLFEAIH